MKSTKTLLEQFIREMITEIQRTRMIDYGKIDQERKEVWDEMRADSDVKPADRINTPNKEAQHLSNLEQNSLEDRIQLAMEDDENQSIDARVDYAIENDDYDFTTADVQAIARNTTTIIDRDPEELKYMREFAELVRSIRQRLVAAGLKFVERPRVDISRRGPRAGVHGRHPFANSGGGGSGMGTGPDGAAGFGFGGGPGAIGSKTVWNPDDPKNLPMGTKKRRV